MWKNRPGRQPIVGIDPRQLVAAALAFLLLLLGPPDCVATPADPLEIEALAADLTLFGPANSALSNNGSGTDNFATCDFNADGVQDLLVGARLLSGGAALDQPFAGGAFLVYGGAGVPVGTIRDLVTNPDVVIHGIDRSDGAGFAVACGDVNADGRPDIVVSAFNARGPTNDRSFAGEVYVIYGSAALPSDINLTVTPPDVTVWGNTLLDEQGFGHPYALGISLALGDLNGDFIEDIVMGAPGAGGPVGAGRGFPGAVFVLYGGPSLPATLDLATESADLTLYGEDDGDSAGYRVGTGDLNGDGFQDLMVSSAGRGPNNSRPPGNGEVYVAYGSGALPSVIDVAGEVGPAPDVRLYGSADTLLLGNAFGVSVSAGDVNGDGTEDILVGARSDGDIIGRPQGGAVYVIYGGSLPAVLDMAGEVAPGADVVIWGANGGGNFGDDLLGLQVAAGDVNGDGIADILAVAERGDAPFDRPSEGAIYVYYGSDLLPAVMDIRGELGPGPDVILYSGGGPANTMPPMLKVAAGDVNGDAIDELIAGAPLTFIPPPVGGPDGRELAGAVFVFSLPRLMALPAPPVATAAHYNERKKKLLITAPGATGDEVVEVNGRLVGPWWQLRRPISFDPASSRFIIKGGRGKLFLSKQPGGNTVVIIKDGVRGASFVF